MLINLGLINFLKFRSKYAFQMQLNKPCSRHSDLYSVKTDTLDNWIGARTVIVGLSMTRLQSLRF